MTQDPIYKAENLDRQGYFSMTLKQYEKAIELFHKAIAVCPSYATAWRNCTEACEAAGWAMDLVAQYHNMASYLESRLAAEDFFDVGSDLKFQNQ